MKEEKDSRLYGLSVPSISAIVWSHGTITSSKLLTVLFVVVPDVTIVYMYLFTCLT